jgi:hypothetical protein
VGGVVKCNRKGSLFFSFSFSLEQSPSTDSATGLTFDGETEQAIVYTPTSTVPTFAESFLFRFELPEEALVDTLRMKISATDEATGGPVRTVIFATSFNQQGIHETTFDTLSSLVASNSDIVSITPDDDLVNHQGRCGVGVWGGAEVLGVVMGCMGIVFRGVAVLGGIVGGCGGGGVRGC